MNHIFNTLRRHIHEIILLIWVTFTSFFINQESKEDIKKKLDILIKLAPYNCSQPLSPALKFY